MTIFPAAGMAVVLAGCSDHFGLVVTLAWWAFDISLALVRHLI